MLLGHTSLEPGRRGGGPVKGDGTKISGATVGPEVAVNVGEIGIALKGVIEREETADDDEEDQGKEFMRQGDKDSGESSIEMGSPKENPVGVIPMCRGE